VTKVDTQTGPPPEAKPLEPLPDSFAIPAQLVERWLATPVDAPLTMKLRRGDFDNLYNSVSRSIDAQDAFQDASIDLSNGDVAGANANLRTAQRKLIEAQNALRQFMAAVMASTGGEDA
jgi:hypothetical protein